VGSVPSGYSVDYHIVSNALEQEGKEDEEE
jgi:hypothetical protein